MTFQGGRGAAPCMTGGDGGRVGSVPGPARGRGSERRTELAIRTLTFIFAGDLRGSSSGSGSGSAPAAWAAFAFFAYLRLGRDRCDGAGPDGERGEGRREKTDGRSAGPAK